MDAAGKGLVVLAFVLLGAALLLGLRPVTSDAGFDCGSALLESEDLGSDEIYDTLTGGDGESGCDKARSDAQTLPIVLGALGVAGFAAGAITLNSARPSGGRRTPDVP